MLPVYLVLAALLTAPSWAGAQEAASGDPAPQAAPPSDAGVRHAIPRGSLPRTGNPRASISAPRGDRPVLRPSVAATPEPQNAVTQVEAAPEPARQAVPRGSRPQGGNPRTGTAVPRNGPRPPATVGGGNRITNRGRIVAVPDRRRTVVVRPPAVYNNYYYYPRRYYPYGYGSFGLGYFYYDPYRWRSPYSTFGYPYSTYGYGSGYYGRQYSTFDIGELRLDVSPRHAHVYVDGYYAGVVDDYDGAFQALKLESGAYRIEITAPGYETLTFDVRINPGQKIRYRGDLVRLP